MMMKPEPETSSPILKFGLLSMIPQHSNEKNFIISPHIYGWGNYSEVKQVDE